MALVMDAIREGRNRCLAAQIRQGEAVLAAGPQAWVTDHRILLAWRLNWPPHVGEWTHDSLDFSEIAHWSEGRTHDERLLLLLIHPVHIRLEHGPARRFLWFQWGNRTHEAAYRETKLSFASRRAPVLVAIKGELERAQVPQGEGWRELPLGTREERLGGSVAVLTAEIGSVGVTGKLRRRISALDQDLHRGRITWWIRALSWSLLAVPAAVLSPWLILPAVIAIETAWVVGLQWAWHRDRHRRVSAS